jgi:hypothetical protein
MDEFGAKWWIALEKMDGCPANWLNRKVQMDIRLPMCRLEPILDVQWEAKVRCKLVLDVQRKAKVRCELFHGVQREAKVRFELICGVL